MQSSPNWGRLFEAGRCKAIGIPWSEEEAHALYVLNIPAEYVRNGCLTWEEYEAELDREKKYTDQNGEKPLKSMNKPALLKIARDLGIVVEDVALKPDIITAIETKRLQLAKQAAAESNAAQDQDPSEEDDQKEGTKV